MARLVLAALVLLVGLTVLGWAIGHFLPDRRTVVLRSVLPRPVEDVWALLTSGRLGLTVETAEEGRRLTARRPAGERVGGLWTFELEPTEGGSALTIEEERHLANPLMRSLACVALGDDSEARALRARIERELSA